MWNYWFFDGFLCHLVGLDELYLVCFGLCIMFATKYWPMWGIAIIVGFELAVPAWAEYADRTPWHPGHISERYDGLLTIIVLGKSGLAATNAFGEQGADFKSLPVIITGGLLILFSF